METKMKLSPPLLRIILVSTIGLLVVASSVGLWVFHGWLTSYANDVKNDNAGAASSQQDITRLEELKAQLAKDPVAVARAKAIVADSTYYKYQNQIIDDLSAYANNAGFQISAFSFSNPSPTTGTTGATTPAVSALPTGTTPAPAGLKVEAATITLPKTLSYLSYMKFLKSIEENLTKMEITGVSVQVDPATGLLITNPLTIGVYVK